MQEPTNEEPTQNQEVTDDQAKSQANTGDHDYNDDDLKNLAEIEEEMARLNGGEDDDFGVSDEEKQMMADLEAEMEQSDLAESPKPTHNGNTSTASRSNNKPSGGYLPPGAVPSQNGVLSKHAAEFWFPEARNCTCCSGFKHGCGCCKGGVDTCTNPSCLSAEPVASQSEHTPAPISAARSTPVVSKAPQGNRSYLPPGAVPSQNGVLSPQAAEFWFPECRNCPCCNGYKHGCPCRSKGSTTCTDPRCLSSEPIPGAAASGGPPTSINSPPVTRPAVAPLNGVRSTGAPEVCRFFASPSGCRSGASCRFYHPGGAGGVGSASNSTSGTPRDAQPCIYFQRGFCQFGASCRFSHP